MNKVSSDFDPLAQFFTAQSHRPDNFRDIDLITVPAFLRSLLVKDGTVTTALSAFYLQPIVTEQLAQSTIRLTSKDDWLELSSGEEVIQRQVTLRGANDGCVFLFANSKLAVQRLPTAMREALGEKNSNLGQLLRDGGLETRRQGLWYGREQLADLPKPIAQNCDGDFISRKYRVSSRGKPLMTVVERFPLRNFEKSDPG